MFLPIIVAIMAFILNSFTYIASFAMDIDPMVKEVEKRNSRDKFALECIESTSEIFMRQIGIFERSFESLTVYSGDTKSTCEISFIGNTNKQYKFNLDVRSDDEVFEYGVEFVLSTWDEVEQILITN